jgi:hypothetical protein
MAPESGAALDSTAAAAYALAEARTRPGAALHPARPARSSQTGIPGLGDFQSVLDILRNEEPLSIYFAQNRGFFGTFRNLSANGSKGKNRPKSLVPSPPAGAFRSCHNSPRTLLLLRLR